LHKGSEISTSRHGIGPGRRLRNRARQSGQTESVAMSFRT
jgi:hypothetical protein